MQNKKNLLVTIDLKYSKPSLIYYFTLFLAILIICFCFIIITTNPITGYSSSSLRNTAYSPILVCYYNFDATNLVPELIDVRLCTHIIAGFAGVDVVSHNLSLSAEKAKILENLKNATKHEEKLKVMLTVGGMGLNSGFGPMVNSHYNRKKFIRSLMAVIKMYHLDGVDIDWEWPVLDGGEKEKVKFSQLLYEIRQEFSRHKKKYQLSVAVAAVTSIIEASYYVDFMAEQVDFVNVMSYDYHFFTKAFPVTDYNAPLYSDPEDKGGVLEDLNVNYTAHYWIAAGMPKNKIVLGMPTYGHTFRLRDSSNHGRHAPSKGFGSGSLGYVNYPDVCKVQHESTASVVWDNASKVPYIFHSTDWISYDDTNSLSLKAELVVKMQLGGAMVYSMNADDYKGICYGNTFPLINAIKKVLFSNNI